jgi:hypothetical protein
MRVMQWMTGQGGYKMSTTVLKDELTDIQEVIMVSMALQMQNVRLLKGVLFKKSFGKSLNWKK